MPGGARGSGNLGLEDGPGACGLSSPDIGQTFMKMTTDNSDCGNDDDSLKCDWDLDHMRHVF